MYVGFMASMERSGTYVDVSAFSVSLILTDAGIGTAI